MMAPPASMSGIRDWFGARLPGEAGVNYRRELRKRRKLEVEAEFLAALAGAQGQVCVDLGANLGIWTRRMAGACDRVIAFEPDPWTASQLRRNMADLHNVTVVEAAAGVRAGRATLYRAREFEEDRVTGSESSSLFVTKTNVDTENGIEVDMLDFPAFLAALDRDVAVLKMDIEGAEVDLLEALFEDPVLSRIGHIFVETHEKRIPELAARTAALHARACRIEKPVINLRWR